MLMHKGFRGACIVAGVFTIAAAHAENWPSRLIKATIPFGPGSATDVVPRMVFDRLAIELGQPIVIENRAGAGGAVHISAEKFRLAAGIEATHVPYRGGSEVITDIIGGPDRSVFLSARDRASPDPGRPGARAAGIHFQTRRRSA